MDAKTIDFLAIVIAKRGAWALFRLDPNGGTIAGLAMRGASGFDASRVYDAAIRATFDEANLGRWTAIANFRKAVA